jgi:glutathione-regulated potassium-efflux system ancillary protein KefG
MSQRVLILFVHPALEKSKAGRALGRAVRRLEGVTFRDLYEEYPDFAIDVRREQQLLLEHDVIVFQHPFYWYSSPALLKEWQDQVLEHGWAYGHGGEQLEGKSLLTVITAGGRREAYRRGGHNHFTVHELLAPYEQTARLCGMHYLPPFVVHGTGHLEAEDLERHAADYRKLIEALVRGADLATCPRSYANRDDDTWADSGRTDQSDPYSVELHDGR